MKRIFYANQQVAFKPTQSADWKIAHGVQSVGLATTFSLEQIFELGQLSIYENIEAIHQVEATLTKVLDGYSGIYLLSTVSAGGESLIERSSATTYMSLGIWPDTNLSATGAPAQQVEMSGLAVTSVSYDLGIEDNFTESVTLVGHDKAWMYGSTCPSEGAENGPGWDLVAAGGGFDNNDAPPSGVQRREKFDLTNSSLPSEATSHNAKIQSINVSADMSRETLFELGSRRPYARVVSFPVEVTCDIEVLSLSGDMVSAFGVGCSGSTANCGTIASNVTDQTIKVATCDGTVIHLGDKNRLSSVNYGGGDAGGGNATVTYSYVTFNDFTVTQTGLQ